MHAIGVDIGATNIRVALADDKGRILVKKHERTIKRGSGTDLTAQVIRMIKEVLSITKTDLEDVKGIGIGTIGPLDLRRGIIVKPANLPFD
ncbi:MAG: ROK family protein, partial [Thermoprotei archaeon]